MKVLVVAAHPDDEVYGCGGAIRDLHEKGHDVTVVVLTEGSTSQYDDKAMVEVKKREAVKVKDILGITRYVWLDYPDMRLDTIPHVELNNSLDDVVSEVEPELVFTHYWGDLNLDHQLAFKSTLVATRPLRKHVKAVYCYEVVSSSEWNHSAPRFKPTSYYDTTRTFEAKLDAVRAYGSEIRSYPHPRSVEAVEAMATTRGVECFTEKAEAFILVREYMRNRF
ncbi:PIG-L family deacetylase [Candidatus Bathyarchaeota archaeon]|nr:PIG-L family deacetylase [Candidatus Bathyarchaeota archaeon]